VPKAGFCTTDAEAKLVHEVLATVQFKICCRTTGNRYGAVNKTAGRKKDGLIPKLLNFTASTVVP
jgi:hypothetical protein